jgi:hypothetical protein
VQISGGHVQERVCYALDAFCESLDKEIIPFLPQLVRCAVLCC